MRLRYKVRYYEELNDEGAAPWIAEIPDVGGGGIATCGTSPEDVRHMARDAVTQVLLARLEAGREPDPPTEGSLPAGWEWVSPDARVELAYTIRQERKKRGLTMKEAAERMGVTFSAYQRWEDPQRCNATIVTLERLAGVFGRALDVSFV